MEDVNAIHRIFKNLKYEMDNNGWVYQWHLGDEPIKVTHKFYPPVSSEEIQLFEKYFPNMKLPASYKAFLSCSNGMELFCGEEGSSLVSCTIYSLKEALNHLPVLFLQDIGDITMDLQAVLEGREDYLCYPAPDTDRFNLPFNEWLERYIVCQGHELWFFLNP